MRRFIAALATAGMLSVLGVAWDGGAPAISAENRFFTNAATKEGKHPFRDYSHFMTSIRLTGSEMFSDNVAVDGNSATYTDDDGSTTTWPLYAPPKINAGRKKLILVFIARTAAKLGGKPKEFASGTGNILITTTDGSTTTSTTIYVESIDTPPAP